MKRLVDLMSVAAMLLIAGCATFDNSVISALESVGITPDYRRGQGLAKTFEASYDAVWKAVPQAMAALDFPHVHSRPLHTQPPRGEVRAFQPRKEWWGKEYTVVIFVEAEKENRTRVEVISAHPMHPVEKIKLLHRDWGPDVMKNIDQVLSQEREQGRGAGPAPAASEISISATAHSEGLQATLRVLSHSDVNRLFGGQAGTQLRVMELKVQNRSALPVVLERKWVRVLAPDSDEVYPVGARGVANIVRPGTAMISTGSNAANAIQLLFGLAHLSRIHDTASQWEHLLPETLKVAAGREKSMLLIFPMSRWTPGLWQFEMSFNKDTGAAATNLTIPLTFRAGARASGGSELP